MSSSPNIDKEKTAHAPQVDQSEIITHRQGANGKIIGAAAAAFAVGVIGAVGIMSKNAVPPAPQAIREEKPVESAADPASPEAANLVTFSSAAAQAAGIKVSTVQRSLSTDHLNVPGTVMVNPSKSAKITPPVSGKIVRLFANPGDAVRAGQSLAVMDSVDIAQAHSAVRQAESNVLQAVAAANTARAQIREAQAKQNAAEATLQRQRDFARTGAFSQGPLSTAQSELSQAQTELVQAQSELQTKTSAAARAERLAKAQIISRAEEEQAQAELRQSQARVAQAQTHVSLAAKTLTREQKVYGGGLLNKQAIQVAEGDVATARAETQTSRRQAQAADAALLAAKAAVTTARSNLGALEGDRHAEGSSGMITLRAPIGGVVTERQATLGEAVERSTSLYVIENLASVVVSANVPEGQLNMIRIGQRADVVVAAYPDAHFSGVVQSLGSRVDEKTRALAVRVAVNNPGGRLRPEMFAHVSLGVGSPSSGIVVPSAAVDDDGPSRFVYVSKPNGFERREVQVGRVTNSATVITSGLKPGERIVTDGMFIVKSESKKSELKGDD